LTSSIHQLDCIKHLAVEEQLVLLVVLEVDLAVNESIGYWPATIEPMKAAISSACTCIRHKLRDTGTKYRSESSEKDSSLTSHFVAAREPASLTLKISFACQIL
jgi:hypothetical protein